MSGKRRTKLELIRENETIAARHQLDLTRLGGTLAQINRFLHAYEASAEEDARRRLTEGDEPPELTPEDDALLERIWTSAK